MRLLFSLIFLLSFTPIFAQDMPTQNFLPQKVDSIRMEVIYNVTKEMLLPGQNKVFKTLGTELLDIKNQEKLIKKLGKQSSYSHGRALLTHHNLVFTFYSGNTVGLTIHISALTRNIDLYTVDDREFYGKISKKFGAFLVKLLMRYGYYDAMNEVGDLEGVQ